MRRRHKVVRAFVIPVTCLVLRAAGAAAAAEASMDIYVPAARAISRTAQPPTVWEAPPRKTGWSARAMGPQYVEEMRALCSDALAARFPGRQNDYVLSAHGGGVQIKAPEEIREAAGRILGALMVTRRMELGLTLEHYALSRSGAERLDGLVGAVIDDATARWLADAGNEEVAVLGRLSAAGVAYDRFTADSVTPVPVAHLTHGSGGAQAHASRRGGVSASSASQQVAYPTAHRGGWFSARVQAAGPGRWHASLRGLLAWKMEVGVVEADVAIAVGQAAVTRTASLRLPSWRSLAFCGDLTVSGGEPVLVALVGTSDDPEPAVAGKPFEALVLRADDPLHTAAAGPVAFSFDGSPLRPSRVLERMREIAGRRR
ncbi:MAG: hypothetical protein ACYSU0_11990, partial [Planctomycetota bacterium]